MSQPPSELSQSGHRVHTGMIQVNSGAHHPVRRIWKPSSREWRKLTRTRLSFPLHREWHQHYSLQTGLLSRKQMQLFPQGESWSELSSMASLTWFPVRRSKCSWFSPAGMEGGVDFRNQVSSQPWTPGNPNNPITYFTSNPRVIGQGNLDRRKSILFLSNTT